MTIHSFTRLFILPSPPDADNDETEGYEIGDTVHVEGGSIYECRDASTGAAVWEEQIGGGVTDHGALAGLSDDDHTQYVKHSLAAAADDFLVASGAGAWVKKTLAETITILRTSLDSIFAPIAKGVTNGDSHDHNGGDGAQIAHGNLSGIGTNTHAQIDTHLSSIHGPYEPGGRPTLVSGTPVMTSEQADKTVVHYTPYKNDLVPIYDGAWSEVTFPELTLNLDNNSGHTGYHEVSKPFDMFVYNDSGTLRLVSGPAWTNGNTRSVALERINGIWMNAASITARFGTGAGDTVTVARDRGTYVGTFATTSVAGKTTWKLGGAGAGGNVGMLYLWSAYHRVPIVLQVRDNTNSWTYGTSTTWRPLNNNPNNSIEFVRGLDEDYVRAELNYQCLASATGYAALGVGLDSTSSPTGILFRNGSTSVAPMSVAKYAGQPGIGLHYVMGLEYTDNGATPVTFYGDAGQTFYQGGLQVDVFA